MSDRPEAQQFSAQPFDGRGSVQAQAFPERATGGGAYYVLTGAGLEAQGNGGLGWSSND